MSWASKFLEQRAESISTLHRSYALRFTDSMATATVAFLVPLMIYNITHNVAWSGMTFMLEWLPRLTAIPLAGPFVDRVGAPRFFIAADSLRTIIIVGAVAWLHHDPRYWPILLLMAILTGMLAEGAFVAAEKLGVEVTGGQPLHRVQAVQVGIDQVVQVLGPVAGGAMLLLSGDAALCGILALLVVSVALAWRLHRLLPAAESEIARTAVWSGLMKGLRVIGKRPSLIQVIVGSALFNLLLALLLTLTPALVAQRFHRGSASISMLWSLAAGASVVAVGIASRTAQRFGITTIGFVSGMVACGACFVAGTTHNFLVYTACLMLFLMMDATYAVFIRTARARMVPRAVYGTTVGVIVLLTLSSYPLAGALVAAVPFRYVTQLVGFSALLTATLSCWSFARMDHASLNDRGTQAKHNQLQLAEEV